MNNLYKKLNSKKTIAIGVIIVFLICIIPLFLVADCAFPKSDDFVVPADITRLVSNGASFSTLISKAVSITKSIYNSWQGSFTAVFIMCFSPAVFGEQYYFVTPFIIIIPLIFSFLYLFYVICKKFLKTSIYDYIIIAFTITTLMILYVPIPAQSFYWWNGGTYYTSFYSITLILIARTLVLLQNKNFKSSILHTTLISLFGFLVGGGNFTSSLLLCAILFFIAIYTIYNKNIAKSIQIGSILLFSGLGLLINIIAPGNSVRQSAVEPYSITKAITECIIQGADLILEYSRWPIILGFIFILPFVYNMAVNCKLKFNLPLIFTGITFGVFAMLSSPTMYALRILGPGRVVNLYYFSYFWLIISNLFYWCGWTNAKIKDLTAETNTDYKSIYELLKSKFSDYLLKYAVIMAGVLFIGILQANVYYTTTIMAFGPYIHGGAATYKAEMQEQFDILNNSTEKDIILEPISFAWPMLEYGNLVEDPTIFPNTSVASYYGKNSIAVKPKN